jgi:hypothetical protein
MKATKKKILAVTLVTAMAQGAMADCLKTNTCEDKPKSGQFGMQERGNTGGVTADAATRAEAEALNNMASRSREQSPKPVEKKEEVKGWGAVARAFIDWLTGLLPSSEKGPQQQLEETAAQKAPDVKVLADSNESIVTTNLCQFVSLNVRQRTPSKLSEAGVALTLAKSPLRLAEIVAFTSSSRQQSILLSLTDKKFYTLEGKIVAELAIPSLSAKRAGLESAESIYTYASSGTNRRALIGNLGSNIDKILETVGTSQSKSAKDLGIGCADSNWQVIRLSDSNITGM